MMKIVIGDDAADNSVLPGPTKKLRDLPPLPSNWKNAAGRPADLRGDPRQRRW